MGGVLLYAPPICTFIFIKGNLVLFNKLIGLFPAAAAPRQFNLIRSGIAGCSRAVEIQAEFSGHCSASTVLFIEYSGVLMGKLVSHSAQ